MADLEIQRERRPAAAQDDYTTLELVYWIVGILAIPLVPILMTWFFTPWSGM